MSREIPYLQTTMYYFVLSYKHNSHYWQGNSTSLMNESKGMNNPHLKIVKCGGTKAQDEKN